MPDVAKARRLKGMQSLQLRLIGAGRNTGFEQVRILQQGKVKIELFRFGRGGFFSQNRNFFRVARIKRAVKTLLF